MLYGKMVGRGTGVGPQCIADTFKRVGLMNAFDGSKNNLVKVQGVENYSFGEGDSESEGGREGEWSGEDSDEESYEESDEESKRDGEYMSDIET